MPKVAVENGRGVGAEADQESRAEIDFAGKAEQQVPGHGEDAEIIGRGQHAEEIGGEPERQQRGEQDDRCSDPEYARAKKGQSAPLSPAQEALRPHIDDKHKKDERRYRPQRRRNQIGRYGFQISDDISRDQRSGNAAQPAKDNDREGARRELAGIGRAYAEK